MLNRRQIDVQRRNLASMCRIAVKSVIDYACLNTHVDEDCEEFINFCAVFEQMVSHRLRPYQKRVWHRGEGTPRHFWDVLVENHNRAAGFLNTCIPNIERIESIKSPKAKLRAFLRVALMEKKLSEYLYWVLDSGNLIRQCYLDGALFASEEATLLCGDLIGLNAIDFNFCLKGNENELLGPLEINYAPFLQHKQSSASQHVDEEEMVRLSQKPNDNETSRDIAPDNDDTYRLQNLEKDYRSIKEQKEYLEELLRLRERQLAEAKVKVEALVINQDKREKDWNQERITVDACVLELQGTVSDLQRHNHQLRQRVTHLQQFKDRIGMKDVPMMDMAEGPGERMYIDSDPSLPNRRSPLSATASAMENKSTLSDQRSIQSSVSDQIRLKEDSHSMIPLTGSLADVNMAMLKDQPCQGEQEKQAKQHDVLDEEHLSEDRSSEREGDPNNEIKMHGMAESYVMAEVVKDNQPPKDSPDTIPQEPSESGVAGAEISNTASAHEEQERTSVELQEATLAVSSPVEDNVTADVEAETGKPQADVMTTSDGSANSSGAEQREEEVLTSDPEILDRVNTSSDGSDAAWEMLSDSEHAEHAH